jgi:predicted nuclease of predicted toxin-antitoxin system
MNLYLDDNRIDARLHGLLRKAGHTVIRPADVRLSGSSDTKHLEHAVRNGLIILTADRLDFWELHELVLTSGGHHPGILLVRFDNDRSRDIRPHHIVRAIGKLERSGVPIADQVTVLNHWR